MNQIVKFRSQKEDLHQLAMHIRIKVFVEEQHVPSELEHEYEDESTHFLIYHNKKAVGTARYRITDKGIKFERFALLKEFRGKGLGQEILNHLLKDVQALEGKIYLHAQISVVDFYTKNGFEIIGEQFEEAGIVHFPMEYASSPELQ